MSAIETDIRVLVIGFGNPLRGDDGVGWVAAQQLADRVDPDMVATMAVHQLTPELAEPISRVQRVIFIDAAENQPAGALSAECVEPSDAGTNMTHHLTPARLLGLSRQLFGKCPRAELFTVGGADFGHREDLSPQAERACEKLVAQIEQSIKRTLRWR